MLDGILFCVRSSHLKGWVLSAMIGLLAGCGGGGGDGGSDTGSSSSGSGGSSGQANTAPTVNAGSDQTVDEQTTVQLAATASDSDGDIAGYQWRQTSGPDVVLNLESLNGADLLEPSFTAPATTTVATLEFRLTVTDNDDATASDTVTVTVNPVNSPPVADAGADQTVDGLVDVTLSGSATDPENAIAGYAWSQVSGQAVTLDSADQATAGFSAPSTDSELSLQFELTITDDGGASDSDSVTVTVIPEDAPLVDIVFPPPAGAYTDSQLSVFGMAEPKNSATIESVIVNAGVSEVEAVVEPDGSWRADGVSVPEGVSEFIVTATATDSEGFSRQATSTLLTDDSAVGEGESWKESVAVAVEPDAGLAYVLTTGDYVSDVRLVPVELETGDRSESITDFGNAAQGPTFTAFNHMIFDKDSERFFISHGGYPDQGIISVALDSGQRGIVSSNDIGSSLGFALPVGLTFGPDGTLFVADNGGGFENNGAVFSVDIETGDRDMLAEESTEPVPVAFPLHVAWDETQNRILVSENITDNTRFTALDRTHMTGLTLTGSEFSSNSTQEGPDLKPYSQGLAMDAENNRVFVMNGGADNILAIDLTTEERTLIAADVTGSTSSNSEPYNSKGMVYDVSKKLLYVVGGSGPNSNDSLLVIDPESGDKVVLSR